MTDIDSNKRIKQLEDQILYHKKMYYAGEPQISDEAYDALEEELRSLDPDNPVLYIVGTPEGGKIRHEPPMLSCQKASSLEEVLKWANSKRGIYAGYKVDGLSLSIIYNNGTLTQVSTRGNGLYGDDATLAAMKIDSIPKRIPERGKINVRGELFMKISEFNRIKSLDPESNYSSPRNLAVGTLKQKDLKMLENRRLDFFAWDLLGVDDNLTLKQKNELLKSWGFKSADFKLLSSLNKQSLEKFFNSVASERDNLDYEIDGVVFKYNDPYDRRQAGMTEHHPKWQIALKFQAKGGITRVKDITWQVGRTGVLTPVAELEPIEVAGATIKRATIHNADYVKNLNVAAGDEVYIIRAGDIIPKLEEVITKGDKNYEWPSHCPSCGEPVIVDGVNLVCVAKKCRDRDLANIRHWVKTTDIKGLGSRNIEKLYDEGLIQHYADLYNKQLTEEKLVALLGKNGSKIKQAIEATRELPFHIFLAALGIETLGKKMGKILANNFVTFEDLQKASVDRLITIESISEVTANYIKNGVNDPSKAKKLFKNGVTIVYKTNKVKQIKDSPFQGKKVYVTGKIEGYTKKEIQELCEEYGLIWSKSITKKLDMLVVGQKAGKAKLDKAKNTGITIINWNDFIRKLQG